MAAEAKSQEREGEKRNMQEEAARRNGGQKNKEG